MPNSLTWCDLPEDVSLWPGLPLSLSGDEVMPLDRQMGRVPSLELCKLYEHRMKRPEDALRLAENLLKDCPADERAALEHRVERLKRKVRESGGNDHGIHGKL